MASTDAIPTGDSWRVSVDGTFTTYTSKTEAIAARDALVTQGKKPVVATYSKTSIIAPVINPVVTPTKK